MQERSARIEDVRHALTHATNCISAEDGKWKVPGHDLDGDELTTVVAIEGDVVVVTVF